MQRQATVAIGGMAAVLLLAFAPGCPKGGSDGDENAQDGGASNASGGGSGGGASQGNHAGTGGKPSNSGTGGHDDGSGATNDAGAEEHDAGHAGDGNHDDDAGAKADADGGGTPTCDVDCEAGTHCELVEVQCFRAPCNPVAQCIDDQGEKHFCGGIAAFDCPGMGECVDDATDDCDPDNGGADCGGVCECKKAASCITGKHWDGSPDVCDCIADDGSDDGPKCGDKTCAKGQECCDALCGTCVAPGTFCTQGC